MISKYEIEKYNNEEVLYIFFDLNNEFSRIDFKNKKEKLEKVIKDFIKENKIIFTGTTVALVVGSTVVGSILLNNDKKEPIVSKNIVAIEEVIKEPLNQENEEINLEENKSIKANTTVKKNIETSPKKVNTTVKNTNNNEVKKIEAKQNNLSNKIESKQNSSTNKVDNNVFNEKQESKVEEKKEEPKENKIYVKVKRKSGEIQNIELEEYVIGVVGAEMPAGFSVEALKSQAVIARTYALKANLKGKTLTDTESTQSYKSNDELKSLWGSNYNTYYNKIKDAVLSTRGMYLTYNGTYIEAVYHSTSNGYTEDSKNVWGNSFPYLVSVESKYDSLNPSFSQQKSISYEELSNKLDMDINIDTNFNIISKTTGNRIDDIEINGKVYKGKDLRNILGLRSADFDIEKKDNHVIFTTRGYGHGVGLSQYGANGMAKNGYTYTEILKHYYKGVSINHL